MLAALRCRRARRLLARSQCGDELSAAQANTLWRELERCPRCRALYERSVVFERLLRSDWQTSSVPLPGELDLFVHRVVQIAAQPQAGRWTWLRGPWLEWQLAPAAVLAGAVTVLFIAALFPVWRQAGFAPRSGEPAFALRMLCQTRDLGGRPVVLSISEDPTPQEISVCPAPAHVMFSYSAATDGYLYLYELTPPGPTRHFPPADREPAAHLEASPELTTVDFALRIERNSAAQRRLIIFWCDEPQDVAALQQDLTGVDLATRDSGDLVERPSCQTQWRRLAIGVARQLE